MLTYCDPPKDLLNDLLSKKVVLFVGAGVSKGAELRDSWSIKSNMRASIDDIDEKWDTDLFSKIAQIYETQKGRQSLISFIKKQLSTVGIKPGSGHNLIANYAISGYFDNIITTNYDCLIEDAIKSINARNIENGHSIRGYSKITNDQNFIGINEENIKVIKLHGCIDEGNSLIITDDDYSKFMMTIDGLGHFSRCVIMGYLSYLIASKTFIFIGYSLNDANFQYIYQKISSILDGHTPKGYAIIQRPSNMEENTYRNVIVNYWKKKDIKVINTDDETFLNKLSKVLCEKELERNVLIGSILCKMSTNSLDDGHIQRALHIQNEMEEKIMIGKILCQNFDLNSEEIDEALRRQKYVKKRYTPSCLFTDGTRMNT